MCTYIETRARQRPRSRRIPARSLPCLAYLVDFPQPPSFATITMDRKPEFSSQVYSLPRLRYGQRERLPADERRGRVRLRIRNPASLATCEQRFSLPPCVRQLRSLLPAFLAASLHLPLPFVGTHALHGAPIDTSRESPILSSFLRKWARARSSCSGVCGCCRKNSSLLTSGGSPPSQYCRRISISSSAASK